MALLGIAILGAIAFWYFSSKTSTNTKLEKIKVGVVAPFSGDNAKYGDILRNSFELAFETDSNINVIYEDSKFDPKTSLSALNKLIFSDKVHIVLGEVASGNTMAIAPTAEKKQNFVIFHNIFY